LAELFGGWASGKTTDELLQNAPLSNLTGMQNFYISCGGFTLMFVQELVGYGQFAALLK